LPAGKPSILHRNIDACYNGRQNPYTIACAVPPQRRTQGRLLGKKNDLLLDLL
jgi:hypothetical protein